MTSLRHQNLSVNAVGSVTFSRIIIHSLEGAPEGLKLIFTHSGIKNPHHIKSANVTLHRTNEKIPERVQNRLLVTVVVEEIEDTFDTTIVSLCKRTPQKSITTKSMNGIEEFKIFIPHDGPNKWEIPRGLFEEFILAIEFFNE